MPLYLTAKFKMMPALVAAALGGGITSTCVVTASNPVRPGPVAKGKPAPKRQSRRPGEEQQGQHQLHYTTGARSTVRVVGRNRASGRGGQQQQGRASNGQLRAQEQQQQDHLDQRAAIPIDEAFADRNRLARTQVLSDHLDRTQPQSIADANLLRAFVRVLEDERRTNNGGIRDQQQGLRQQSFSGPVRRTAGAGRPGQQGGQQPAVYEQPRDTMLLQYPQQEQPQRGDQLPSLISPSGGTNYATHSLHQNLSAATVTRTPSPTDEILNHFNTMEDEEHDNWGRDSYSSGSGGFSSPEQVEFGAEEDAFMRSFAWNEHDDSLTIPPFQHFYINRGRGHNDHLQMNTISCPPGLEARATPVTTSSTSIFPRTSTPAMVVAPQPQRQGLFLPDQDEDPFALQLPNMQQPMRVEIFDGKKQSMGQQRPTASASAATSYTYTAGQEFLSAATATPSSPNGVTPTAAGTAGAPAMRAPPGLSLDPSKSNGSVRMMWMCVPVPFDNNKKSTTSSPAAGKEEAALAPALVDGHLLQNLQLVQDHAGGTDITADSTDDVERLKSEVIDMLRDMGDNFGTQLSDAEAVAALQIVNERLAKHSEEEIAKARNSLEDGRAEQMRPMKAIGRGGGPESPTTTRQHRALDHAEAGGAAFRAQRSATQVEPFLSSSQTTGVSVSKKTALPLTRENQNVQASQSAFLAKTAPAPAPVGSLVHNFYTLEPMSAHQTVDRVPHQQQRHDHLASEQEDHVPQPPQPHPQLRRSLNVQRGQPRTPGQQHDGIINAKTRNEHGNIIIVSKGSVGHPHACQQACKYHGKKSGCKDGKDCDRCHLCFWTSKLSGGRNSPEAREKRKGMKEQGLLSGGRGAASAAGTNQEQEDIITPQPGHLVSSSSPASSPSQQQESMLYNNSSPASPASPWVGVADQLAGTREDGVFHPTGSPFSTRGQETESADVLNQDIIPFATMKKGARAGPMLPGRVS
ncbi:unnamed protein product [Amoebophrya sp. A120]|nr:unnamed protein product [Amoebophrya sp. A120]|eukprot:GSA120T00023627001.1